MSSLLNWGKLVSQGRAKAQGVSWSEEEGAAIAKIAKTLNKSMSEVAHYVRKGILTVEDYQKAENEMNVVSPYLKLSKDVLIKKAQKLGLSVSPDATVEVLVGFITAEEKKLEKAKKPLPVKPKIEPKEPEKKPAVKKVKAKPVKKTVKAKK